MEEALIELKHVNAYYGKKKALCDLNLSVRKNRITAVIGPSGCGKSTLLRVINGMLSEEGEGRAEGEVLLSGKSTARMRREELCRRIGLVFQTPAPFPFSIYKNLIYAPVYYGEKNPQRLRQIAEDALRMTGLYEEVKEELNKPARRLSGGQQQRLCIARALTADPEALLLDEPCSALDVRSSAVIEELLLHLKERYTILIVTHNIAQARRIADRVVFLSGGRLIEEGEKEVFFANPSSEEARAFLTF